MNAKEQEIYDKMEAPLLEEGITELDAFAVCGHLYLEMARELCITCPDLCFSRRIVEPVVTRVNETIEEVRGRKNDG
jgi:hypothetical protein